MNPAFDIAARFRARFQEEPEIQVAAPARVELAGNHTDHQGGEVLAASVNRSLQAAVRRRGDRMVRVVSAGYPEMCFSLDEVEAVPAERGTSAALVRGVVAQWRAAGCPVAGWDAVIAGDIPPGSGLSSSAAFAILLLCVLNELYAEGRLTALDLARMAREAEVGYFGKPCGMMDQWVCATGGICRISFQNRIHPALESIGADPADSGLSLAVVQTGGNHADLTHEYAAIADEMRLVARFLGGEQLADVPEIEIWNRAAAVREAVGDRAWLRAVHFYEENRNVQTMTDALKRRDAAAFLSAMKASGHSSVLRLQNISSSGSSRVQSIAAALASSEHVLHGAGACRVHGGGFAGTILVCMPAERMEAYTEAMTQLFGSGAVLPLQITGCGAGRIDG